MFLMYCGECRDVVKLVDGVRACLCGAARGRNPACGDPVQVSGDRTEVFVVADTELDRAAIWVAALCGKVPGTQGPGIVGMMLHRNDGSVAPRGQAAEPRRGNTGRGPHAASNQDPGAETF